MNQRGLIVIGAAIVLLAGAAITIAVVASGDEDSGAEATESTPESSPTAAAPNFDGAPAPASPGDQQDLDDETAQAWTYDGLIEALENPRRPPDPSLFPETSTPSPSSPAPGAGGESEGSDATSTGEDKTGASGASCRQPSPAPTVQGYGYVRGCHRGALRAHPVRTIGILFFKVPQGAGRLRNSQCTATVAGTAIDGQPGNESVIVTAGHCIGLTPQESADDRWTPMLYAHFIPSFRVQELYSGRVPKEDAAFRRWFDQSAWLPYLYAGASDPIPVAYVPQPYRDGKGTRWDFGAMVMQGHEQSILDELGGLGVDMDGPAAGQSIVSYGYPADPPFDGTGLFTCKAKATLGDKLTTDDGSNKYALGIGCDMTGGASGGPWLRAGDKGNSVVSVNSYSPGKLAVMFGPTFNDDHWSSYLAARNFEVP